MTRIGKLRSYCHTAFTMEDSHDGSWETDGDVFWAADDSIDDATLESMAADDDGDTALVLQFEDAVSELVQNESELSAFYTHRIKRPEKGFQRRFDLEASGA